MHLFVTMFQLNYSTCLILKTTFMANNDFGSCKHISQQICMTCTMKCKPTYTHFHSYCLTTVTQIFQRMPLLTMKNKRVNEVPRISTLYTNLHYVPSGHVI